VAAPSAAGQGSNRSLAPLLAAKDLSDYACQALLASSAISAHCGVGRLQDITKTVVRMACGLVHGLATRPANKSRKAASIAPVLSFTNFGTGQSNEHR
jgi:uncharacterized protein (UPF0261 family)